VLAEKRPRRVTIGDFLCAMFENHDTVLLQIQEMLRTERITREPSIEHEISTYNELIPAEGQLSLTLFVVALRQLGAARTSAYFGLAPFWGALLAIALLGEPLTPQLLVAALLMAVGVALHLTERHQHLHHHAPMSHRHRHHHALDGDPHHDHSHAEPVPPGTGHSHFHHHPALSHDHPHFPDAHHGHRHPD